MTGEPIREAAERFDVSGSYVSKVGSYVFKVQSKLRLTDDPTPGPQRSHSRPRLEPLHDVLRARLAEEGFMIAELRAWVNSGHSILLGARLLSAFCSA